MCLGLWLFFNLFSTGFHFFFDHLHERFAVIVTIFFRIPFRAHAVDERFGHVYLAFSGLDFLRNVKLVTVGKFFSKMHQLENKDAVLRFYAGEVLTRFDYDLGDSHLFALLESIPQKDVGFVASFLGLQIVRLVEKHRIYVFLIDKILDVHGLGRF